MDDSERKALIESLIFVSETPLSVDRIREILGDLPRKEIQRLLSELVDEYQRTPRGFTLVEVAGGFQFRTRPEHAEWIRKMKKIRPLGFSPAAMETLAIVAYRQPIVRAEIEKIRGVDCGGVLRTLLERKLIKIIGKKDVPGKPLVYGTTQKFLETFGLKELSSLPTLKDLESLGSPPTSQSFSTLEAAVPISEPSSKKEISESAGDPQSHGEITENPIKDGDCLSKEG